MKNNFVAVFFSSALTLTLGGCNASTDAPAPPETSHAAAVDAASGCVSLRDWEAAGYGTFKTEDIRREADEGDEDAEAHAWTVRFTLNRAGKTWQGEIVPPYYDPAAILVDEKDFPDSTQVCLDHVFVANFPSERGGSLFIANQYQDKLIVTEYGYDSGEEDIATVSFRNGAINVRNSADPDDESGRNLVEEIDPEALTPHGYVGEAVSCRAEDELGTTVVRMPINAAGKIFGLDYLSMAPEGMYCGVDAMRGDNDDETRETTWNDEGNRTRIVWKDKDYPSEITITREGDLYTIDARRAFSIPFCGQSAQLAETIKLRRGGLTCEHVQWPEG